MAVYNDEAKIYADLIRDKNRLKSQIAGDTDVIQIGKRSNNYIKLLDKQWRIKTCTPGEGWRLGDAAQGVLGVWTGTYSGNQLVLGNSGQSCSYTIIRDTDLIFEEDFSTTRFQSTGSAYWNTTGPHLAMSSSSLHSLPYVTYYDIGIFYLDPTDQINAITITATETKWNPADVIRYFVSIDNKANFEECTNGTKKILSVPGVGPAYIRIMFVGNGANATYITDLTAEYELI